MLFFLNSLDVSCAFLFCKTERFLSMHQHVLRMAAMEYVERALWPCSESAGFADEYLKTVESRDQRYA